MTRIVQITKDEIFMYHDYSFMLFDRNAITCDGNYVGWVWPAGKIKQPNKLIVDEIQRGSCYHTILTMELIQLAEK